MPQQPTRPARGKQKAKEPGASSSKNSQHKEPTSDTATRTTARDGTRTSKWTPEAIEERLKEREERLDARRASIEALKTDGNKYFQAGDYHKASSTYSSILKRYGSDPIILSNMSLTLLKLEDYQNAEMMALEVLKREPANWKARHRRGLARKGLKRYIAALADFSTVLSIDPTLESARQEQRSVMRLIEESTEEDEPYVDPKDGTNDILKDLDPDFPHYDQPPIVFEEQDVESDSEDAAHKGNGIPCKYYNRGTCVGRGNCKYSHAPDSKSQRDKLGRNVCNYYLLGNCIFGEQKCYYIHDKTYLGHGWWNDESAVASGRELFGTGQHPGSNLNTLMTGVMGKTKRKTRIKAPSSESERFEYSEKKYAEKLEATPLKQDRRYIMVLALENELEYNFQQPTLSALRSKLPVKIVSSATDAFTHLSSPDLAGVFATDGAISEKNQSRLLLQIVEYVKAGGRLVLGGGFSSFIKPPNIKPLFRKFGLQWGEGDYCRTTFSLNKSSILCQGNPSLNPSYSMKAVHLTGVGREHAVYLPTSESRLESLVWSPQPIGNRTDPPAAYAPVGKGFLGYVGDVNWEDGSINVVLAALGLLDTFVKPEGAQSPITVIPMPVSSRKQPSPDFILIISLSPSEEFPVKYERMLTAVGKKINYEQVLKAPDALSKLNSPHLKGVFVTDITLAKRVHGDLVTQLIRYVKHGGHIVFGAEIGLGQANLTTAFLQEAWDLPWAIRDLSRTTAVLDIKHKLARIHPNLPRAFTMEAAQVSEAHRNDILYVSYTDFDDLSRSPSRNNLNSPLASTKVEEGRVTYIGDVNLEEGTIEVLLTILCPAKPTPPSDTASANVFTLFGPSQSRPKPFSMVLTLDRSEEFAKDHADVLGALGKVRTEIVHGLSVDRSMELLDSRSLFSVFVPYADIVKPQYRHLVQKLVKFTKDGGSLVVGGHFAESVKANEIGPFFRNWGIGWKAGKDSRQKATRLVLNNQSEFAQKYRGQASFPYSWQMFALQLSGLSDEDEAIYVSEDEAEGWDVSQSPVVIARVEDGRLGFIGETMFGEDHTHIAVEMLAGM